MNRDVHVQFYYFISLFKFFLCSPQINQNLVRAKKFYILFIRWTYDYMTESEPPVKEN